MLLSSSSPKSLSERLLHCQFSQGFGSKLGFFFQAEAGSGKTSILQSLQRHFIVESCIFDCSQAIRENGLHALHVFKQWVSAALSAHKTLLLLDNIDGEHCGRQRSREESVINKIFKAGLATIIDQISEVNKSCHANLQKGITVICSCTYLELVPASLTQPYRLGSPLQLGPPTATDRAELIRSLLTCNRFVSDLRETGKLETMFASSSLQGLSAAQIAVQCKKGLLSASSSSSHRYGVDDASPHQDNLIGIDNVLERLKLVVSFTNQASIHEGFDSHKSRLMKVLCLKATSGILIEGPPGCGKTAVANWLVSQMKHSFRSLSVSCADLVHKVVGESEEKITDLFTEARRIAPCFLVLDNIEIVLGAPPDPSGDGVDTPSKRSNRTTHAAIDRMLSTFLVEIDGVSKHLDANSGAAVAPIIVIATTSNSQLLDRALRRPGRLEEHIVLQAPDAEQRWEYFKQRVLAFKGCSLCTVDESLFLQFAQLTQDKVYSDIKVLVQEASILLMRQVMNQHDRNDIISGQLSPQETVDRITVFVMQILNQ